MRSSVNEIRCFKLGKIDIFQILQNSGGPSSPTVHKATLVFRGNFSAIAGLSSAAHRSIPGITSGDAEAVEYRKIPENRHGAHIADPQAAKAWEILYTLKRNHT